MFHHNVFYVFVKWRRGVAAHLSSTLICTAGDVSILSSDKEVVLAAEGVIRLTTSLLPRFVFSHILLEYDESIQYLHIEGCKSWWLPGGCLVVATQ